MAGDALKVGIRAARVLPYRLTPPFFRSIVPPIPQKFLPERSPTMPFFLHQVSYTPDALTRLLANPQDRFDAVRPPIEKLGGRVMNSYFSFGQYQAVLITEMPDNVSAAAIALAFAAGGSPLHCQNTAPLST